MEQNTAMTPSTTQSVSDIPATPEVATPTGAGYRADVRISHTGTIRRLLAPLVIAGTVLAVTHDRWFARGLDRFIVVGGDGVVRESADPIWDS